MTDLEARLAKLAAPPKARDDGRKQVRERSASGSPKRVSSSKPALSFNLKKKEKCSVQEAFELSPERGRGSRSSGAPERQRIVHPSETGARTIDNREVQPRDGGRYQGRRSPSPAYDPEDSVVDKARNRRSRSRDRRKSRSRSREGRNQARLGNTIGAGNIEEFSRRPASKRNIGAHAYSEEALGGGRRKHEIVPTTSVMPVFSNNPSEDVYGSKAVPTKGKKGDVPDWLQDLVDRPKKEEFERPKVPYKEIHIPYNLLSRIIGRGGEIIQSIHSTSGCKISLHQENAAHSGMVVCILTGSDAAMNSAEHLIHQRVGGGDSGVQTKELHIPSDRVSAVIGPRASILNDIRIRSGGLRVEIQPPDLVIIGPGSTEQLLVAEALIMTRVEGKPLRCCPQHLSCVQMPIPKLPENSPFAQANQSPFILSQPPPKPAQPAPAVARDALFEDVD